MTDDGLSAGWVEASAAAAMQKTSGLAQGPFLRSLIERAKTLSHPTLSSYRVGAVGLGGSGAIYLGANIEFSASQLCRTIHAEQSVVINAMAHGETRLAALAISAAPCGSCRQFLQELADADGLAIWLARETPYALAEFLPDAFGPHDLGVVGGLLAPQDNRLVPRPSETGLDSAGKAALDAANRSYAPYTKAFAGCALVLGDGSIWTGAYVENAAFNPSLSPSQAALITLIMAGRDWKAIQRVVIAEVAGGPIDHRQDAAQVLASLGVAVAPDSISLATEQGTIKMSSPEQGTSFYLFDFDDNIMFLKTPILLRNKRTEEIKTVSTDEFATIRRILGAPGEWLDYEQFEQTYMHFGDRDPATLKPGERQYLLDDVAATIAAADQDWQAPSWPLLLYACDKQRPVAIVTARGHSRETIKAGIKLLVDAGLLSQEPNYLEIYAVNNPQMKSELAEGLPPAVRALFDQGLDVTSDLKRVAINRIVDKAAAEFGPELPHRFGMSDDDPTNVDLIVKAMCDSKKRYMHMRFFVIDTHKDEHVKLEVFPADYPVAGHPFPGRVL